MSHPILLQTQIRTVGEKEKYACYGKLTQFSNIMRGRNFLLPTGENSRVLDSWNLFQTWTVTSPLIPQFYL